MRRWLALRRRAKKEKREQVRILNQKLAAMQPSLDSWKDAYLTAVKRANEHAERCLGVRE